MSGRSSALLQRNSPTADAFAPSPTTLSRVPRTLLQRQCACGGDKSGDCDECSRKKLSRRASGRDTTRHAVPPVVAEVLSGQGRPLDAETRAFMEPRFGHDFSRVRVHADAKAAEAARAVNALAFTVGRDIVFDASRYAPGTGEGRKTLAHELTHVVQQSGAGTDGATPTQISSPEDAHEREADRFAETLSGESAGQERLPVSAQTPATSPMRIQRLIRQSLVNGCGAGQNPFNADRRAVTLLTNALDVITRAEAARAGNPADADVVTVGNALRSIFHFDPANEETWTLGAPQVRLPVIKRRIEIVRDYINSVVFTVNCCEVGGACPATCGTCTATENAFVCGGEASTITLCPRFWGLPSLNERGRSYAHEIFHVTFGFIEDWDQPNVHNAHCYAHFVALLNGFQPEASRRCH